jgi:hypothetical protein
MFHLLYGDPSIFRKRGWWLNAGMLARNMANGYCRRITLKVLAHARFRFSLD